MGKLLLEYLEGDNIYACLTCGAHLSAYRELLSKAFRGRGGKAFLFKTAINICEGPIEERLLLSGCYAVCDLSCKGCLRNVGWKYEKAQDADQKYKEGKFILEKCELKKEYWTY